MVFFIYISLIFSVLLNFHHFFFFSSSSIFFLSNFSPWSLFSPIQLVFLQLLLFTFRFFFFWFSYTEGLLFYDFLWSSSTFISFPNSLHFHQFSSSFIYSNSLILNFFHSLQFFRFFNSTFFPVSLNSVSFLYMNSLFS